jgi:hypothetical protein
MPEDQQSSVLIEAIEEHDDKRKNLSRILTAWKRLKRILAILGKPVSDIREMLMRSDPEAL